MSATTKAALPAHFDNIGVGRGKLNQQEKRLAEAIIGYNGLDDDFNQALVVSTMDDTDGTVYTGDAGEKIGINTGRAQMEARVLAVATGAAVIAPFQSADGLEVKNMAGGTGPSHWELTWGITALSKFVHTVGTSLDSTQVWSFSCTFKVDDISDVTDLLVGFRKAEAYRIDYNDYDEAAAFHIDTDGDINIIRILNNAATATGDTTANWADGNSKTFKITVDYRGRCRFFVDGTEYPGTRPHTFDSGEVIIPFFHVLGEVGDAGVSISNVKIGYLPV